MITKTEILKTINHFNHNVKYKKTIKIDKNTVCWDKFVG